LSLINCSVVNTESSSPGAGVFNESGSVWIANSILWGNGETGEGESAQIYVLEGSATLEHTCVQGWTGDLGGTGNAGGNPHFEDADGADNIIGTSDDNARLGTNSSCRDAGNAGALPGDWFDLDGDGDANEAMPVDLDFEPRVAGPVIDIGAFEF
jgi:hypothetical protein